jgi:hypothetical protein
MFSPHILVCHQDLLLTVCSAKSLNLAMKQALPWLFHDDGSLTTDDKAMLMRQFPGCRVINRAESDEWFRARADKYPRLTALRQQHVMLLKLADVYVYSNAKRVLYVDSDVLFFNKPEFLIAALHEGQPKNYFNRDLASAYITTSTLLSELTGVMPPDSLNAGLSALNRDDIALVKIEKVLQLLDDNVRADWLHYSHLIEQTAVALLSAASSSGTCHLPAEYDVSLDKKIEAAVCKHYVGVIRDEYELEGLAYLLREGAFLQRWRSFAEG